jgi:cytochrome P450
LGVVTTPRREPVRDIWDTKLPGPPYFDPSHESWVFSRYADVAAALREACLAPASARSRVAALPVDGARHAQFRAEALRTLAPARLRQWEAQFASLADQVTRALPVGQPVDLVEQYAKPWSLEVAGIATEVPQDQWERLSVHARSIFESGCEPYDPALAEASQQATRELVRFFQGAPALHMQMFIALAHSLPSFLGAAWLALLQHPAQMAGLRQKPALLGGAIDELLRFAGPGKAQFRQAVADVTINGCNIRQRERVMLMLDIANRDPEHFSDPGELQFEGRTGDHLAFGAGLHACVAGTLIRSAAAVATRTLMDAFNLPDNYTALPANCFAVRYLRSLIVVLERLPAPADEK